LRARERKFKVRVRLPRPPSVGTSQPSLSFKPKANLRSTTSSEESGSTAAIQPTPATQRLRRSSRMRTAVLPKKTYVVLDE